MKKIYITTPAYYPNNVVHLGHAYTTIAADVIARWHSLKIGSNNVMFISGLDEHGSKIEKVAKEKGMAPQEFVDMMAQKFLATWKLLNISYNGFIRTSEKRHEDFVTILFKKIYDNGDIYKGVYEDWYCTPCESYWTETQLINGKCPSCKRDVERLQEDSYFFKLSGYKESLLELYKKNPDFISPPFRRQEIINRMESELKDLSISRKNVAWGIPVPIEKDLTLYVWLDALSFYITVLGYKSGRFKRFWPPDVQLMAKEILWFHVVIWPALLMSAKIKPLPKKIFAHGWLTVNGEKMSKSKGNFIIPEEMVRKYSVDCFRYYLFRDIPFGEDGDFSEGALKARYNGELANDLGNLVSRVLSLAEKNFNGKIKKHPVDKKLSERLNLKKISKHMENLELHLALYDIMGFVKECNKHVNDEKLWEKEGKDLELHLYSLLEAIRIIAILLQPFIPESAEKINKQLGIKQGLLKDCKFGLVKNYNVKKEGILFQKVDVDDERSHQQINHFSIDPQLKKQGINVCMALIKNVPIANKNNKIEELKKEVAKKILGGKIKNDNVLNGYKEFYHRVGMDCLPAAENLINLVNKNKGFPNINNVVDCYNAVSAETGLSFGAHDADRVEGELRFKTTNGSERFVPLGEKLPVKINKEEYAFMDDKEILCRIDIKQCDKTKITKNTKNIILYAQGNQNVKDGYLKDAVVKVCETLKDIYGCGYSILKEVE